MVIGLFLRLSDAEIALNNLAEAEFGPERTSLVMRSRREVDEIADLSGPLNGLAPSELFRHLLRLGLAEPEASEYRDAVLAGEVFIAISSGPGEKAAAEMLEDANARLVRNVG